MKYGYSSIMPIISEVQAQFKLFAQTGILDTDDCINYAIQALREIGHNNYETKEQFLYVTRNRVALPHNIFKLREVRTTHRINELPATPFYCKHDDSFVIPGTAMMPSDTTSVNTYDKEMFTFPVKAPYRFNFRQPPGVITVPFTDEYIYVKYRFLPQDDDGNYLMQDNEETVKAVKDYVLFQSIKPLYFSQQIPQYIYKTAEMDSDNTMRDAVNAQQMLDEAEINAMVVTKNRKFNRFKLKR